MIPTAVFTCPNPTCAKRLKAVAESSDGKAARCHGCGARFKLVWTITEDGGSLVPTEPLLPDPPAVPPTVPAPTFPLPVTVGRYRILSLVGSGAFGLVYRARDPDLDRDVALKVPKPGTLTSPARVKRFLGDAKASARLRHPHIVPVFDVGEHGGAWFIASAFVDGRTLADALEEGRLDLRAKAAVVRRLAEALDYAHGQGVVHRDVKPDNVMLDAADQPHLIDFGLAKLGDDREGGGRAVMGTAVYMSPEQAAGRSHDADARSDQYSLGVTFYEMLGGRTPFSGPTSVVLFNVVKTEPPPLAALNPALPLDLLLICQRAMAKDPAARYASCGELADDLRRWLEGETPRVRVLSRRERLARWVRKEPKLAGAVAVAALAVLLAAVLGITFGVSSSRQARNLAVANGDLIISRDKEEQERKVAEAARLAADEARKAADASAKNAETARQDADTNALKTRRTLAAAYHDRAAALCEQGEIAQGMNWFLEALREAEAAGDAPLAHDARVNLAAWRYQLNSVERVVPLAFKPLAVAVSTDQMAAVTVGADAAVGFVQPFDSGTGKLGPVVRTDSPVRAVAFDPTSGHFVTGDEAGRVQVWTAAGAKVGLPFPLFGAEKVLAVAVHPGGRAVAAGGTDGFARLVRLDKPLAEGIVPAGKPVEFRHEVGFEVNAVAFHPNPDTSLLLTGSGAVAEKPALRLTGADQQGEARLFDTSVPGKFEVVPHARAVRAVAFHPHGRQFATGTGSMLTGEARVWATDTLRLIEGGVFPHLAEVTVVAYSPNGQYLLTGGQDRSVRVWDAARFRAIGQPLWHGKDVLAAAVAGDRPITVSGENAVRLWAVAPGPHQISAVAVTDGPLIAVGDVPAERTVWIGRLTSGLERRSARAEQVLGRMADHPGTVRGISAGPNAVAVGGGRWPFPVPDGEPAGFAAVYDSVGKRTSSVLPHDAAVWAVGLAPDEKALVTGDADGTVRCWPATGIVPKPTWQIRRAHTDRVYAAVYEPVTGAVVVTCGKDDKVKVWDAATGKLLDTHDLPDIGTAATFSADGSHFLVGYAGGSRLFRLSGGEAKPVRADLPHQAGVLFVSVDAAGETALTGGTDRRVRWWDLRTGKPLGPGWPLTGLVRAARFTAPDSVFVAETGLTRGGYRTFALPQEAVAPVAVLTDWVRRVSGMKVTMEVAEVLPVAELIKLGNGAVVKSPEELAIATWRQRRPVPPPIVLQPLVAVKSPEPVPPAAPLASAPPKPASAAETGGIDLLATGEALFRLLFGR